MKFFADASFLYNVYYPEQVFSTPARRLWQREHRLGGRAHRAP